MANINPSQWTPSTPETTGLNVAGQTFWHYTPKKDWSFKSSDNNEIRFELRKGEVYSGVFGDTGSPPPERTEIGQNIRYNIGQFVLAEYKFMIEPGSRNTARWLTIGQWHSALAGKSPPLSVVMRSDDKLRMLVLGDNVDNEIWVSPDLVARGHWYSIQLGATIKGDGTNGRVAIRLDGQQLCDVATKIGFQGQTKTWWKQGIYRATAPETMAVRYKDLKLYTGAAAEAAWKAGATATPPAPTAPAEPTLADRAAQMETVLAEHRAFWTTIEAKMRDVFK